MKIQGNGQAAILSTDDLNLLFNQGFETARDKALFGVCYFTACRISEALNLRQVDVTATHIVFRKQNTKGKLFSREARITQPLQLLLDDYKHNREFLFPAGRNPNSRFDKARLTRASADRILRDACNRVGLVGVSTHSFRRSSLTAMANSGVPLRVIQKISGHTSLEELERYLAVSDEQLYHAALTLEF